jgi:hypothetical protein
MKKNKRASKFVVCVWDDDGDADLEVRKIYRQIPDRDAERDGVVRIIDESGEDYLYPAKWFLPLELPRSIEEALESVRELQTS